MADHELITGAFLAACERLPNKPAVVDGDIEGETYTQGVLTYGALRGLSSAMGRLVATTTEKPHVGIMLPSCKEFPAAFFGVSMAGKIPAPLNFLLQKEEIAYILKDADIDTVITSEYFRPALAQLPLKLLVLEELARKPSAFVASAAPPANARAKPPCSAPRGGAIRTLLQEGRQDACATPDSDVAVLLYTSGTTGYPKGVMLTHKNLLSNVQDCKEQAGFHQEQVFLGILPLFHSFALTCSMLVPLLNGATAILMKKFQPARVVETVKSKNVNVLLGIPSQFRATAKARAAMDGAGAECGMSAAASGWRPADGLAQALEICVAGGEALPEDVRLAFENAFGVPLHEGYGMTETSPVISVNTRKSSKPGTVGKPLPSVEVRIADDDGRPVGREQDGEIYVRGPNVMKGYYNQPDATRESICAQGWLRTGDVGRLDTDGFLKITGRKKEMILSSGENIFPSEIERCLATHPAVGECAVIGVADGMRGEVPKAFVVLREGCKASETELRDYARDRIASYKVPRCVEFRPELPHGPTGKVLKKALR